MVDLDKFICSLIKRYCEANFIDRSRIRCWLDDVLEDCGVEYKDGALKPIKKEGKPVIIDAGFGSLTMHFNEEEMEAFKEGLKKKSEKEKPKFKVGDWVVNKFGHLKHITKIKDVCYYAEGKYVEWHDTFEYVDTHFRLWTIQDAKPGDMLSFNDGHGNDCIELIKSITDKKIEFWFCLTNGNRYEVFDGITPYTNLASREDATPATKEQRDLLFKRIEEVGYKWNADTLTLEKIEKPSTIKFNEPDIEGMVEDFWHNKDVIISSHTRGMVEEAYRQGLEDMFNVIKGK